VKDCNSICRQSKLIYYIDFLTTERYFHHRVLHRAEAGWPAAACPPLWKTFSMEFVTLKHFIPKNPKDLLYWGFQNIFCQKC